MSKYAAVGILLIGVTVGKQAWAVTTLQVDGPTQNASISVGGEVDWYSFRAGFSGRYNIETTLGTLYDSVIYLYGPNSQTRLIERDDDGGNGRASRISRVLEPATYYVKVVGYRTSHTGSYLIGVTSGLGGTVDLQVNGPAVNGVIGGGGEEDLFRFTVSTSSSHTIETFLGSLPDSYISLYDSAARLIESDDDDGEGQASKIIRTLAPGTYYVKARGYGSTHTGTYSIRVTASYGEGTTTIAVDGASASGAIDHYGEEDWYQFTVNNVGVYLIETRLGTLSDSHIYLYGPNSRSTLIEEDDDDGEGLASRIERSLAIGTYFLKVKGSSFFRTGSYSISVKLRPQVQPAVVFLVHGLGQSSLDLRSLAENLRSSRDGLSSQLFSVDNGFDWSSCTRQNSCSLGNCTIPAGAHELARYINQQAPSGRIVLVGYSLGGLLIRDMLLNNREGVASRHTIQAIITLGSPHVGYPYCNTDDRFKCNSLIQQMASHYRVSEADNQVILSEYLYDLNVRWLSSSFNGRPPVWLVASGTACTSSVRGCMWEEVSRTVSQGCRANSNNQRLSDTVVCDNSALLTLSGSNLPTDRWSNANYRHTSGFLGISVLCGAPFKIDLFDPPTYSDLFRKIVSTINGAQ